MRALNFARLQPLLQVRWRKWIIVATVLVLAYLAPVWHLDMLLLAPNNLALIAEGIGILVMLQRPDWGIAIMVVGAVTPPIGIGTGTRSEINPAMILVAGMTVAWLVRMLIVERRLRFAPTPANAPLLGLALVAVISVLATQVFGDPTIALPENYLLVQLGGLGLVLLSVAAFGIGANVVREVRWLKIAVGLMVVLGVLAIASVTLPGESSLPYLFPGVQGLYWMWAPALAYAQILFNHSLSWRVKAVLVLTIMLWIWWAWIQVGTLIALLVALFVAMMVITWLRSPRLGLFVTGLFLLSVLLFPNEYYQKFYVNKLASYNRPEIWMSMVGSFGDAQPLIGLGPATYSWYAMAGGMEFRQSHSNYVDLFLQFGVLGLGCFLAVFAAVLKRAWDLRNRWAWGFEKGYVIAVLGGVCGALAGAVLADWVLPQVYNLGLAGFRHSMFTWFLSGGLIALGNLKCEG